MNTRKIEPTEGVEVYIGKLGHVCIAQDSAWDDGVIVAVRPGDVPQLIAYLWETYEETQGLASPASSANVESPNS
jgi:hypothetical protein